jgi:SRSO17 transposase
MSSNYDTERMVYLACGGLGVASAETGLWRVHPKPMPKNQVRRWESDGQEGGRWLRYTPGVSCCWACEQVINEDGECEEECYGTG